MSDHTYDETYRKEWTLEALKLMVRRKNHFEETLRITREISEALDRNDRVSVQMLLGMRATELEGIDKTIISLERFKEQLHPSAQQELDQLMKGQELQEQSPEMGKIASAAGRCQRLLQDIIAIDKRMSRHVAGADSFYKE